MFSCVDFLGSVSVESKNSALCLKLTLWGMLAWIHGTASRVHSLYGSLRMTRVAGSHPPNCEVLKVSLSSFLSWCPTYQQSQILHKLSNTHQLFPFPSVSSGKKKKKKLAKAPVSHYPGAPTLKVECKAEFVDYPVGKGVMASGPASSYVSRGVDANQNKSWHFLGPSVL